MRPLVRWLYHPTPAYYLQVHKMVGLSLMKLKDCKALQSFGLAVPFKECGLSAACLNWLVSTWPSVTL